MKRYAVASLIALAFVAATVPCQAQLLQKLEQGLLGGQQQGGGYNQGMGQQQGTGLVQQGIGGMLGQPGSMGQQQQGGLMQQIGGMLGQGQGQAQLLGNVNLPPAQYMMTNVQTGQAFYVTVQNSQMFLSNQQGGGMMQQGMGGMPGQMMQQQGQGGLGGLVKGGLGSFLKNELSPQQQPLQSVPNQ